MKRGIIIALAIFLLPMVAWGQDEKRHELKGIVVTSRVKPAEATLQRVVIDTNIMKAFKSSSLGDLLIQNSPINIKSYGRGNAQTAVFRGTAPSHTQVYWNGIRINSPMEGSVDFRLIPNFFIDKLTIDAGVSSMNTASGALGGTVNIESSPMWNEKFGIELVQNIGSFTSTDSYANIRVGNKAVQSSTKLLYSYSKNDFPFLNNNIITPGRPGYYPTERNRNGDYHRSGFMQEFYARPSDNQTLSAIIWGTDCDTNFPQLTTYEGNDQNNLTNGRDKSLRAALTHKYYSPYIDIVSRLTGDVQSKVFTQQNYMAHGHQITIDSRSLNRSVAANVDVSLKYIKEHTIALSANATLNSVESFERVRGLGFVESRAEFSLMGGIYSQWLPRLGSSLAVRGLVVGREIYATPFAGIEFRITDPLSLKGRIGYNAHNPSLSDLYYVPGGNPDLRTEKGVTAEVGITYNKKRTKIDLNLFNSWIEDWIIWMPHNLQYSTPQNQKKVLSQGVELIASNQWRWGDWALFTSGNFTINRTINNGAPIMPGDMSIGKQLPFVPLYSGGVYLKGSWRNVWLSVQTYGESIKYTKTSNTSGSFDNIDPYVLTDIAAGYSWSCFNLELRCRNIFDDQLHTVYRRPLPGRSYEAMLRVKL